VVSAATGRASVTPHRTVTLGGSFTYSDAITYVDARQTTRDRAARVDGMASWSPVTTIGITATVGHEIYRNSGTLGTLGISASPFRDGALQLVFAWTETLDTVTDVRTRQWGPSLRWRLSRRGFLNVAYSNTHLRSPAWNTDSQAAFANLILNLG